MKSSNTNEGIKRIKWLAIALTTTMAASALAGCSGDKANANTDTSSPTKVEEPSGQEPESAETTMPETTETEVVDPETGLPEGWKTLEQGANYYPGPDGLDEDYVINTRSFQYYHFEEYSPGNWGFRPVSDEEAEQAIAAAKAKAEEEGDMGSSDINTPDLIE
jgi:hypothetical protein